MITALTNARVLLDHGFAEGRTVLLAEGKVLGVVSAAEAPQAQRTVDLQGLTLVPGFVDTQVNGGGGVLFNDSPTVEPIVRIGAAHRRFGTTGFLPTLISDDLQVVAEAIDAVDEAIAQGVPGVLGIHIDGPFLNVKRKGVHDASKFRALDEASLPLLPGLQWRYGPQPACRTPSRPSPKEAV